MLCIIDDFILNPFQTSNKRTILGWSNLSSCFNKAISRTVANGIPSSDAFLWFLKHAQTIYFYFGNTFINRNISIGQHKKTECWLVKNNPEHEVFSRPQSGHHSHGLALFISANIYGFYIFLKITTYPSKLGHHK